MLYVAGHGAGTLGFRAAVAALFLVAFFALAAGAAAGLTVLGLKLITSVEHLRGRGIIFLLVAALGCFCAAGVIVWSALPRIDRFVPPGPEIASADEPELFRQIGAIAATIGQPPPLHVYLIADVNAFVTERGESLKLNQVEL